MNEQTVTPLEFAKALRTWLADRDHELAPFRSQPPVAVEEGHDHEQGFHRLLYDDGGWTRWGWPKWCGGLGGHESLRGVLADEIYAAGYYLPEAFTLLGIVGPTIVHYAPALATRYMPAAMRGDESWCQGFSEPDAGSDLAALRTRADHQNGDFCVNGQKVWSSLGHVAKWCLLLARTRPSDNRHDGLSMLWVDLAQPGVIVRPISCANGRQELSEIFFDNVSVPQDHLVGELHHGWEVAMYLLQFERGNYGWQRQAWLHARLHEALLSTAQSPTGDMRAVHAAQLGAAYVTLLELRATSLNTLLSLAEGGHPGAQASVDKVLMSTAEQSVLDAVRSLMWPAIEVGDDDKAKGWRRDWFYTRAASIYGGAVEVQRDILAEHLVGLPRSR